MTLTAQVRDLVTKGTRMGIAPEDAPARDRGRRPSTR
jgi:hypothetical protein